jgi:hypothetical protein
MQVFPVSMKKSGSSMQVQLCIVATLPCVVAAFWVSGAAFSCNDPE